MRIALAALLVLLPGALLAVPNLGLYLPGQQMSYSPAPYEEFSGYLYLNNTECYITAIEFMIGPPEGIVVTGFEIPEGSLSIGTPTDGLSITYWPPLNGFLSCNYICTINFVAMKWCVGGGGGGAVLVDAPLYVLPHPETGMIRVTCWPENYLVPVAGLTSTICPYAIATKEKSWGAIKSLYE